MKTRMLDSIPPKSNPFHYDPFNMGTRIATNVMIMHSTHDDQTAKYIIVVNTETGERMEIRFEERQV